MLQPYPCVEPILGNGMRTGDSILLEEKQGSVESTRGINEFEYKYESQAARILTD